MTIYMYYLLKTILCSGILYGYYHLCLRDRKFHRWNRFYLISLLPLSLLIPVIQFKFNPEQTPESAVRLIGMVTNADQFAINNTIANDNLWEVIALACYGLASLGSLWLLLKGLLEIRKLIRSGTLRKIDPFIYVETYAKGTPFSFFRYIFWNPELEMQSDLGKQIMAHELVHVKDLHSLDKLLVRCCLVPFWFNPFFWLLKKELDMVHEFIADEKSVPGRESATLAALLLKAAYPTQFNELTQSYFQSSIKRRLAMLSKNNKTAFNYLGRVLALPLLFLTVFLFAFRFKEPGKVGEAQTSDQLVAVIKKDTLPWQTYQKKLIKEAIVHPSNRMVVMTFADGSKDSITLEQAEKEGILLPPPPPGMPANGSNITVRPMTLEQVKASKAFLLIDNIPYTGDRKALPVRKEDILWISLGTGTGLTEVYGAKAKEGVIMIKTKQGKANGASETEKTFSKTEVEASVSQEDWKAFLNRELGTILEQYKNKVAEGTYTFYLQFIVGTDGTLSDIKVIKDPVPELGVKLVDMMSRSPKWTPAMQNGKSVRAYHTQPVTLVITAG
ncbi:MAG TPA: M56 family metallopeptidase [Flavisolibacter sp.]|nr:M56 family metallopeptidase [Flavisolibacter sp.]